MWIYYMSFASTYMQAKAREFRFFLPFTSSLFQKAVSLVGTDPGAGKLWDLYVMYESSCVPPFPLFPL